MLSRKRKTKAPCPGCFLHLDRCICHLMTQKHFQTRLTLVVNAKELKRTTNTGRLAVSALSNSQMVIRGLKDNHTDLSKVLDAAYTPLFLYPEENAVPLTIEIVKKFDKPIQLLVPDGNWRQASKVSIRHKELKHIQRVYISKTNDAQHHLRKESSLEGMATLEAIAEAYRVIDGEESYLHLRQIYDAKLKNTLVGRGILNE